MPKPISIPGLTDETKHCLLGDIVEIRKSKMITNKDLFTLPGSSSNQDASLVRVLQPKGIHHVGGGQHEFLSDEILDSYCERETIKNISSYLIDSSTDLIFVEKGSGFRVAFAPKTNPRSDMETQEDLWVRRKEAMEEYECIMQELRMAHQDAKASNDKLTRLESELAKAISENRDSSELAEKIAMRSKIALVSRLQVQKLEEGLTALDKGLRVSESHTKDEFVLGSNLGLIRIHESAISSKTISLRYLCWFLNHPLLLEHIEYHSRETVLKASFFTKTDLERIRIPLPPIEVQEHCAQLWDLTASKNRRLQEAIEESIEFSENYILGLALKTSTE